MVRTRKVATKSMARKAASKSRSSKPSAKLRPPKPRGKTTSGNVASESPKAMRLTFSYDGDKVRLVSQQPVEMLIPPSDPVKGFAKQKGFWAELKSAQDKTLYRRVMHNPTRNDAEVFSDDPEQSISREPAPKRKGVFVVVVPDTDKGQAVTLSRSSPETKGPARGIRALASKPATEIARFKLKK
jgi:hypothetical protein